MKTPYRRGLRPLLLIAGLLGGILDTPALLAADVREQLSVAPGRTLNPREAQRLSSMAARVLRQIAQARGAIHDHEADAAKTELHQARVLLDRIKSERPTSQVKDHIWVAKKHLNYEDTEEVAQNPIPIYADLTAIEDIVPLTHAREHLDNAKAQLAKGDNQAARKCADAKADLTSALHEKARLQAVGRSIAEHAEQKGQEMGKSTQAALHETAGKAKAHAQAVEQAGAEHSKKLLHHGQTRVSAWLHGPADKVHPKG